MGLNFTNTDIHWGWSYFGAFRRRLAKEAGIDLEQMQGFGGARSWDTIHDDIVPFLACSDVDTAFKLQQCETIALRLRELVRMWPMDDGTYDKYRALEIARAMEKCVKEAVDFEFL